MIGWSKWEGNMPTSVGWSKSQVVLHWTTVALVIFQLFIGDAMSAAWQARQEGGPVEMNLGAILHIIAGVSVLLIMLYRLYLRRTHGHPPRPENQPKWAATLGAITHGALYLLLLAMPLSGAVAWFFGVEGAANVHEGPLRIALIAVVLLHAAGALVEHFVFQSPSLKRMLKPES
ncbi:cytochrome b [Devosia sp. RR2S18]|uniref:cytochrome b n=1 Tax=Devosia rhizosphaerae TaxID=3049774 RepID=UPI002541F35B|nr:cytochrome b/b6 domain-containing protein [Devosia sp. RR2S18]WIJ25275.1 cytochrome b/b6 domain-containing protein [Devosia sp. RR2S18]